MGDRRQRFDVCLFGGTFDPPHAAHRRLAETVLAELAPQRLLVLPCADHPFKGRTMHASATDRLAMCELAFAGLAGVSIDREEIDRPGPSYTVDTLRRLRARGVIDPALLLGSDNLPELHRWHDYRALFELATPIVYPRTGHPVDAATLAALPLDRAQRQLILANVLDLPADAVSSTAIREQLARGERPAALSLPVAEFIERRGLYRADPEP